MAISGFCRTLLSSVLAALVLAGVSEQINCKFDDGTCDWMNLPNNQLNWQVTASSAVPDLGGNSTNGRFLLVPLNATTPPGRIAYLRYSKTINGAQRYCLNFDFTVTDRNIGGLSVWHYWIEENQYKNILIWTNRGERDIGMWQKGQVLLERHQQWTLMFEAISNPYNVPIKSNSSGVAGIALDNISYRRVNSAAQCETLPDPLARSPTLATISSTLSSVTTEPSIFGTTQQATVASTEATIEASTAAQTYAATEATTEASTEANTETSTAGRTNVTTEATTEATFDTTTDMSTLISTIQITVATTESSSTATTEQTAEATTQSSTAASTQPTTQASTRASTAASTQTTTRPTTQMSTRPSTRASTRPTTPATTVPVKIAFNIRLDKYSNPTNKKQDGSNCDVWGLCDPFFKIFYTLTSAGGTVLEQDEVTTSKTDNVGEIEFVTGEALGFTNPIKRTAFPGTKVSVEVTAYDDDSWLGNDLIGVFEFSYEVGAPTSSWRHVSGTATFFLTFF